MREAVLACVHDAELRDHRTQGTGEQSQLHNFLFCKMGFLKVPTSLGWGWGNEVKKSR